MKREDMKTFYFFKQFPDTNLVLFMESSSKAYVIISNKTYRLVLKKFEKSYNS